MMRRMSAIGIPLVLALVAATAARAQEVAFLSTQLRPIEEAQKVRSVLLKGFAGKATYLIEEPDPAKRERMAHMLDAEPETMRAILAHLETRHGGAERYLLAAGVAESDVARLWRRIRG